MRYRYLETNLGRLLLAADDAGVRLIDFQNGRHPRRPEPDWLEDPESLESLAGQLTGFLGGKRETFDLALAPQGTPFQLAVWRELEKIPYGTTISYADLAERVGNPKAVRAVGTANGANPLPIVIPCHRVIGADGSLTGYGGGLENKEKLLALEGSRLRLI